MDYHTIIQGKRKGRSMKEIDKLKSEIAQLKEYEKKSLLFEEAANEAIAIMDRDFRCIDINQKVTEMFQYTREELLLNNGIILVAPESRDLVIHYNEIHHTAPYEAMMIRKDGSKFWGLIKGKPMEYQGREVLLASCVDITEQKEIQDELARKKNEFEAIFNTSQAGIILTDEKRIIRRANDRFNEIAKIPQGQSALGKNISEFHISMESYEYFSKLYIPFLIEGKRLKLKYQYKDFLGNIVWLSVSGRPIDTNMPPDLSKGIVWVVEDITKKKEMEEELKKAYGELKIIFDNTMMGIMFLKGDRTIYRVNNAFLEMSGYDSMEELIGKSTKIFHLSEKNYDKFGELVENKLKNKNMDAIDWQVKKKDGSIIWLTMSGRPIDTNDPPDLSKGVVWVTRDITQRKEYEHELKRLSMTDSLTGAFNRRYFMESAERELNLYNRHNESFSILLFDLDYFKMINDTYGHSKGDEALVYFTKICKEEMRKTDIFARVGGEEFGAILTKTDEEKAVTVAERIRLKLLESTQNQFNKLPPMTVSVGVLTVKKKESLENLMKEADAMLYRAKTGGRNRVIH